jgi:hypothetical protein
MVAPDKLPRALKAVAAVTVLSGAVQMVAPGVVLGLLAGQPAGTLDRQLFGTVGMFMVGSGAVLALGLPPAGNRALAEALVPVVAAQKLGAAAAVAIGVRRRLFARRGLLLAGFDLGSALACAAYWRRLRAQGG